MQSPVDTVKVFYEAQLSKDWNRVRAILADNFTFKGVKSCFDSPDAFVAGISRISHEGVVVNSRYIVDGNNIAHVFTWRLTAPVNADIPMCEVFEVIGQQLKSSVLFYDSRAFPANTPE